MSNEPLTTPTDTAPEPKPQEQITVRPAREIRVVQDDSTQSYLFDTARFEHAFRIAEAMAYSNLIPKHLREDKDGPFDLTTIKANCFQVVNQAIRWGFDPFALLKESYVVGGNLGWQGKLIAAVINARAGLKGRLKYTFAGEGKDLTVTVTGTFGDEEEPCTVTLSVAQAKTSNDIWVRDPEQKLCYSGAIKWARRHCPEIVLGVLSDDDVEKIAASTAKPAKATIKKPQWVAVNSPEEIEKVVDDIGKAAQAQPVLQEPGPEPPQVETEPSKPTGQEELDYALEIKKISHAECIEMLKAISIVGQDLESIYEIPDQIARQIANSLTAIIKRYNALPK